MDKDLRVRLLAEASNFDSTMRASLRILQNLSDITRTGGKYTKEESQAILECVKSMGSMKTSATTTKGALKQLETMMTELTLVYNKFSDKTKNTKFGREFAAQIDMLNGRIRTLKGNLGTLDSGTAGGSAGSKFGAFGAIFKGNLAARAAMDGIRMLSNGIKNAIQTNMEFEQANANLAAVLGKTRDEISALTQNAKMLGATTIYTAGQITELQTVLARRGFSDGQILQMTKGISSLATATQTDLATAAEIAGSTMQSFGLNASQMDDIVATLGVSTTKSALTMEKLKTSLAYVAPAAKAAGFSLEDTVAMLGTLADAGLPATTAGVAVRNILVHLSTESSKLSKAIGHPVRSMDEFVKAMNELKNKGGNNLEYISSLVEKRVIPGFSVFMSNADKMKELRSEITNVRSELQDMVDKQIDTLQGSVTLMKSAWDGLMLSFSNSNGTLKKLTDGLTALINKMIRAKKLQNGGVDAISVFESSDESIAARAKAYQYRFRGMESKDVVSTVSNEILAETTKRDKLLNFYNMLDKLGDYTNYQIRFQKQFEEFGLEAGTSVFNSVGDTLEAMAKRIAEYNDNIAFRQKIVSDLTPEEVVSQITNGLTGADGTTGGSKKTPAEKAQEKVAAALNDYEVALQKAAMEKENGRLDDKKYANRMISIEERLYDAYADAYFIYNDPAYKDALKGISVRIQGLSQVYADLTEEERKRLEKEKALNAQMALDNRTLNGVIGALRPAASHADVTDMMSYFGLSGLSSKIAGGADISDADWKALEEEINAKLKELKLDPIQIDVETGKVFRLNNDAKEMSKAWQTASSAISSVGSALAGLDNPVAKVAGTIAQAIANVALGAGKAISAKDTTASGWAWIGAAATITAEMIGTIAAIKSAVEYHADGGFAGGLARGTDRIPAMLTPGELVLNAAQQNTLANNLSAGGFGNLHIEKVIGAEEIRLILTNNNRRRRRAGSMSI